jgi:hypothetical protein
MKHLALLIIIFCSAIIVNAQTHKNGGTYLSLNYNGTLNDHTKGNNPSGIGLGLQTFINIKPRLKATIEYTGFLYLENDKVLRVDSVGNSLITDNDVRSMGNLLAGLVYLPTKQTQLSLVTGPSFINGHVYFTIKPSVGYYLSQSQRWLVKLSYLNVVNRYQPTKQDFNSLCFSIGLRL